MAPLLAGCGADHEDSARNSASALLLQPAGAPGPGAYTASTVRELSVPAPRPTVPHGPAHGAPRRGTTLRTVSGGTPGLYGGIEAIGSCDAARQLDLLRADRPAARAFARAARVSEAGLPGLLRGLTPVVLRADTRVGVHLRATGAGGTGGTGAARQAVLQAGTAVLVDRYGVPRVRCAGGTPLSPPVAAPGPLSQEGTAWSGYRPERAVVVRPAERALDRLILLDVVDGSWIERATGGDGPSDTRPEVLPPVVEDELYSYPPAGTAAPDRSADLVTPSADGAGAPVAEGVPAVPGDTAPVSGGTALTAPGADLADAVDGPEPSGDGMSPDGVGQDAAELLLPAGEPESAGEPDAAGEAQGTDSVPALR
ncbi:hypothetical protein BB341_01870 [Streptomyces clavuligerus]|nr:hypothetical protein BB341_01870 [Streptomyces clavuligerus]